MPIPIGAHMVRGNKNRVILPSGETVTRARALTLGAQQSGFRSHNDYRGYFKEHGAGDEKYYRAWLRTEQGQQAQAIAADNQISPRELKQQLINARNSRPRGGRSGGSAYQEFMEEYDMYDQEDWIDY
jgi:hypothetical protein